MRPTSSRAERPSYQIVYVGLAYGALLVSHRPPSGVPAWWLVGMGTLLVAAIVIMTMRVHVEQFRSLRPVEDARRTDPLTRLSNRRGFRELLDLELERARRGQADMTVLVGDLDRFKEVNDRLGPPGRRRCPAAGGAESWAKVSVRSIRRRASAARSSSLILHLDASQDGAFLVGGATARPPLCERSSLRRIPCPRSTISFGLATYPTRIGETAASSEGRR